MNNKAQTSEEGIKDFFQWREKMEKACHIKGDKIIFADSGVIPLEIPLDECNTPEKILDWTYKLIKATWITKDVVGEFIRVACSHHGLKLPID